MATGKSKLSIKSRGKSIVATIRKSVNKQSIIEIFKNKVKRSKLSVKDIELIEGMDADDIKKRFSIKGSKVKILENMITDYKNGKLSLPGLSHKSKFDDKVLNKSRIIRIMTDYENAKRKREIENIQKNIELLRKKFELSSSQTKVLDKINENLNKGQTFDLEKVNERLNAKKLDKYNFSDLIDQYEEAEKQNRGVSFLITKSKLSIIASKRRLNNLLDVVKNISLSKIMHHSKNNIVKS